MVTSPIRIAIDARPFAGPPCGYTIYLGGIIACLRTAHFELVLLTNQAPRAEHQEDIAGLQVEVFGRLGQIRWEHTDLPRHIAAKHYDVYFTGANRGIPLRKHRGTRYVLGLLDVIPYLYFRHYHLSRWKTLRADRALNTELISQLIAVARADAILTISEQSALDIRRIFHRRNVKALLIRLKPVVPVPEASCERQFVYVGGSDFRKRVDVLLRGFAQFRHKHPDYRLVLVGWNYHTVGPMIAALGLQDGVSLTGFVDHDAKFRILSQCVALVYPSIYEGYGMAIAEGFQAGIPVIAGSGGAQREVGGSGMRVIDPLSADDIASAMTEMLDPETRAIWQARGRDQLARLTDASIEKATVAYFEEQGVLARRQRS